MASTWLEWQDVKTYDGSWSGSYAQLFVPHHQWTFKIEPHSRGKVKIQIFDHQEPMYDRPVEYPGVAEAKHAAVKLVDKWRERALAAGYAWSFADFPEYRPAGGKRRKAPLMPPHGRRRAPRKGPMKPQSVKRRWREYNAHVRESGKMAASASKPVTGETAKLLLELGAALKK